MGYDLVLIGAMPNGLFLGVCSMVASWIKNQWICDDCAIEKGGECMEVTINGKIATCPYCKTKNRVLTPWFAYHWPNDLELERCALANRDGLDLE